MSRPRGRPTGAEFAFTEEPVPVPRPGTALVENVLLSVDPYMRENMDADWELSTPLEGRSIGRVTDSRTGALAEGDLVFHRQGWRTHAVVDPKDVRVLPQTPGVPPETYLGILGGTGLTAHVALSRIARLVPGETVYVSAAAGGVGSAAVQLGKAAGATVIGVVGGPEKAAIAGKLGCDLVIDRRSEDIVAAVKEATGGRGADVVYDPVGGDAYAKSVKCIAFEGRVVVVGFAGGDIPAPALNHALVKNYSIVGLHWGLYNTKDPAAVRACHDELTRLAAQGVVKPLVSERVPMAEAANAVQRVADGTSTGRIVVLPEGGDR
ncbi:MAG TPA: alcohol dehydrogenase [Streptomyces sp.]|nr:alcohol dehydrogenase [Streptomyces sp.]